MSIDRHSYPSCEIIASLRASLTKLNKIAESSADLCVIDEFKRTLLLRIAELEAEREPSAHDAKAA